MCKKNLLDSERHEITKNRNKSNFVYMYELLKDGQLLFQRNIFGLRLGCVERSMISLFMYNSLAVLSTSLDRKKSEKVRTRYRLS